jgi:hypothetical protein
MTIQEKLPRERTFTIELNDEELRYLVAATGDMGWDEFLQSCGKNDYGNPLDCSIIHKVWKQLYDMHVKN